MTVSGCFRVLIVVELIKFWPAVNVFTVCKFLSPFLGRSRGRKDLFFLENFKTNIKIHFPSNFLEEQFLKNCSGTNKTYAIGHTDNRNSCKKHQHFQTLKIQPKKN